MEISQEVKDKILQSTGKVIFFRNGSYKYIPSERYTAMRQSQAQFVGASIPRSTRIKTLKQSCVILQRLVCQPDLTGKKSFIG